MGYGALGGALTAAQVAQAVANAAAFKYVGATAPTDADTTYAVGDLCKNTSPIPGGVIGWVCTTGGAGTSAVWKPFGPVTT